MISPRCPWDFPEISLIFPWYFPEIFLRSHKIPPRTSKYQEEPQSTQKYLKVPRSTSKYPELPEHHMVWPGLVSLEQFGTLRAICRMDGWDGTFIPEQPAYKSHRRAVLTKQGMMIIFLLLKNLHLLASQESWIILFLASALFCELNQDCFAKTY